jgi:hypothetical protein
MDAVRILRATACFAFAVVALPGVVSPAAAAEQVPLKGGFAGVVTHTSIDPQ